MIVSALINKNLIPQARSGGPYTIPQYIAPWELVYLNADIVLYAIHQANNPIRIVEIEEVSGGQLPTTFTGLLNRIVLIEFDTDLEAAGFAVGQNAQVFFQPTSGGTSIILAGTILAINGPALRIRFTTLGPTGAAPAFTTNVERAAIFQEFLFDSANLATTISPIRTPKAVLVGEGDDIQLISPFNGQEPDYGNPDAVFVNNITPTQPNVMNVFLSWSNAPVFRCRLYRASFYTVQNLAVRTQALLQTPTPQPSLYPLRLYLLYGVDKNRFGREELYTSYPNLLDNNEPIPGPYPVLSGSQGAWSINYTLPTGYTLLGTYLALHNDDGAHNIGAAANSQAQTQPQNNLFAAFTNVPPRPRVIAVAVVKRNADGRMGVKVSEPKPLAPPTPPPTLQINYEGGSEYAWDRQIYSINFSLKLRPPIQLHEIRRIEYWTTYEIGFAGPNGFVVTDEILMEEYAANVPPNHFATAGARLDAAQLWHFPNPLPARDFTIYQGDDIFYGRVPPLSEDELHLFVHNPVYLFPPRQATNGLMPLPPDANGRQVIHVKLITHDGRIVYGRKEGPVAATYTREGAWSDLGHAVQWRAIYPQEDGEVIVYRAAVFRNDASVQPITQASTWQSATGFSLTRNSDGSIVVLCPIPDEAGRYVVLVRVQIRRNDGVPKYDYAELYSVERREQIPALPRGETDCPPCIPMQQGEAIPVLFPELPRDCQGQLLVYSNAGDWYQYQATGPITFNAYHCGFIVVPRIPENYLDLELEFDNRVWGRAVRGRHLVRLPGVLRRIDDEYSVERYVTRTRLEGDIYRGYRRRYEVEVLVLSPCALWGLELAKFAKRIKVKTRTGMIREVNNLVAEDFSVNDKGAGLKAILRLREETYRHEYRY